MGERTGSDLLNRLTRDLGRLGKYEGLLETQEKLIERGDFESLPGVLAKKEAVLAKIESFRDASTVPLPAVPGRNGGKNGKKFEELRGLFLSKVEELAARDQAGLKRALQGRAELAGQLRALFQGKKLLRGYKPQKSDGKARFKDIKT